MTAATAWLAALAVTKLAVYLGVAMAVGGVLFRAAAPQREPVHWRGAVLGTGIATLASALFVVLHCGALAGKGLAGLRDPILLELVLRSAYGDGFVLRLAGLAILLGGLALPRRGALAAAISGALAIGASFAVTGLARTEAGLVFGLLVAAHLAAVFCWVGALLRLGLALDATSPRALAVTAARLDRWGLRAAAALGVAGGAAMLALALSGMAAEHTAQGLKLAAAAMILGFAAHRRTRVARLLRRSEAGIAARLRRALRAEGAVLCAVLVLAAVTTVIVPGP